MPLTNEHVNKLRDVLEGRGRLHVGIGTTKPRYEATSPEESLNFLNYLSQDLNASLQAHPNDLGLIVTPEDFLRDFLATQQDSESSSNPIANIYKNALEEISRNNPNIIYNTVGLYHKPITHLEKGERQLQNLQDSINNQEFNYENADADGNEEAVPIRYFVETKLNDISNYNPVSSPAPERSLVDYPIHPLDDVSTVKNQSNYHWGGDKIASYKKSSYFNEITPDMFQNNQSLYVPGNRELKAYGNANDPLGQISRLLYENIHPEICLDQEGACAPDKKIYTLQSQRTDLPEPPAPLSIYADTEALNSFYPSNNSFRAPSFSHTIPPEGEEESLGYTPSYYWPIVKKYPNPDIEGESIHEPIPLRRQITFPENTNNTSHLGFTFSPITLPQTGATTSTNDRLQQSPTLAQGGWISPFVKGWW